MNVSKIFFFCASNRYVKVLLKHKTLATVALLDRIKTTTLEENNQKINLLEELENLGL